MQEIPAYKSTTGKFFRNPQACLHEEIRDLRETVIAWANALVLLPSVDIDHQFQQFQQKVEQWHAKGTEYHNTLELLQRPKPENLTDVREEYRESLEKTGTGDT